jgi:hypothetical protein
MFTQQRAGCWLGALGYMVMLDQIGECFRPTDADSPGAGTPDFIKALTYFADEVRDPERQALYALRCCFAHDYSLVNIPAGKGALDRQRLHHLRNGADYCGESEEERGDNRRQLHERVMTLRLL